MGWVRDQIRAERNRKFLPTLASQRLEAIRKTRHASGINWNLRAIELVKELSPFRKYDVAHHFAPYGTVLDNAFGSNARLVFAGPPQHGKTEVTKAGLLKLLMLHPAQYAYVTYNQDRANTVSDQLKAIALNAGIEVTGTKDRWALPNGATIIFTSIGGRLTGDPINGGLIIDDPFKDEEEARSPRMRERADDWLERVGLTRCHPGAFVVLMATRWHEDDLSGRCVKKRGWKYLNIQAVAEGPTDEDGRVIGDPLRRKLGEALWHQRPLSFLAEFRRNPWTWNALYQGDPRPRGARLFKRNPPRYDELPKTRFIVGHGVDLAYTAKTSSDWSVCVSGRRYKIKGDDGKPRWLLYITHVKREQAQAPDFARSLRVIQTSNRGVMRWNVAGVEKGSADFIAEKIPSFEAIPASSDKFTRAQPASEKWNNDEILLPSDSSPYFGEWVGILEDEVAEFTGNDDPVDDQVDALSSLVGALDGAIDSEFFVEANPQIAQPDPGLWAGFTGNGF